MLQYNIIKWLNLGYILWCNFFVCKSIITKFSGNVDQIISFHANVQAYSNYSVIFL